MKTFFVVLLCVAGALARSSNVIRSTNARACPLPDPVDSEWGVLNVTLHPIIEIFEGSERGRLIVTGLTTLNYTVDINVITLNAHFEVTLGSIDADCKDFKVDGWLDARPIRHETLPSGNFTGTGAARITASNAHIKGNAVLFVNLIGNKVSIRILNLETVVFDSLSLDFGPDYLVNGEAINWEQLNQSFKTNFDQDFAQHNSEITEKIRNAGNIIVGRYTLAELIDLIGGGGGGGDGDNCATTVSP